MLIKRLSKRLFRKVLNKLSILMYEANDGIANETLPRFGNNPGNLNIALPRFFLNPEYIFLGDDISLGSGTLLLAVTQYPHPWMKVEGKEISIQRFVPRVVIGNRVTATANLQIAAMSEIAIEDDVMFASNINITDGMHGYENPYEPFVYQKMFRIAPIRIKRGCWIGQNVVILPGVTIGECSIIGANSVVTKSIPDRCIAVGAPARVIKTWDEDAKIWVPVS